MTEQDQSVEAGTKVADAQQLLAELEQLGVSDARWPKRAHTYFSHTSGRVHMQCVSAFFNKAVSLAERAAAFVRSTQEAQAQADERRNDEWRLHATAAGKLARESQALLDTIVARMSRGQHPAVEISLLRTNIEGMHLLKAAAELAKKPEPGVLQGWAGPTYTTQAGESLCGIAIRQLKDEVRWSEIRDLNADRFPDMLGADYYPVGTQLRMPAARQPAH